MSSEYPKRFGKYLRPTILLLTCQAMGGSLDEAINTAAAMQLSEEWILIHDDIEDGSEQRRKKPTLHKIYPENLAINAGDALHSITRDILATNFEVLDKDTAIKINQEFSTMITRTVIGQTVEMKWIHDDKMDFSDDDWYFIADGKTSYYTVAGPIRLGAILAGATDEQLDKLADFGINIGRGFQLVDDILDVTSDFDGHKKQIGNDIYESKRTLILGHLLRTSSGRNKEKLESIISKHREDKSEKEVMWVIDLMKKCGSIEYAKEKANMYKTKALKIKEEDLGFLNKEPYRKDLSTLLKFIFERDH